MIIIPTIISLELPSKVLKRIKQVSCIEQLVVLPMAAFRLSIVPGV